MKRVKKVVKNRHLGFFYDFFPKNAKKERLMRRNTSFSKTRRAKKLYIDDLLMLLDSSQIPIGILRMHGHTKFA